MLVPCTDDLDYNIVYCPAGSFSNSSWPQTLAGTFGTFTCSAGYFASNPSVYCAQNGATGTWGSDPCQPIYCPAGSFSNATWLETLASTFGTFSCTAGYFASNTSVYCTQNGATASWGSNPCQPVYCPAGSSSNATWLETLASNSGTFTCTAGYFASIPSVSCTQNGGSATWGSNPCQPVFCSAGSSSNATWLQTLAETYATFTCLPGYHAPNPLVFCSQNGSVGTWGVNPCQPLVCSASFYQFGNAGCVSCPTNTQSSVGSTQLSNCTCLPGYQLQNEQCQRMRLSFSFLCLLCFLWEHSRFSISHFRIDVRCSEHLECHLSDHCRWLECRWNLYFWLFWDPNSAMSAQWHMVNHSSKSLFS